MSLPHRISSDPTSVQHGFASLICYDFVHPSPITGTIKIHADVDPPSASFDFDLTPDSPCKNVYAQENMKGIIFEDTTGQSADGALLIT